ncbi:hypothetical protein WMY93_017725 [Mugilogobius chulae]|uniref:NOL9 C-terminal domain-containing protein n=1 Tax=Mugilogobius chulae TaxID=88201 RepID=A0AAW0NRT3_9GOBI
MECDSGLWNQECGQVDLYPNSHQYFIKSHWDEPLLGPPFTHQRTPEHMIYYGQSSCESDLDRYLEALNLYGTDCLRAEKVHSSSTPWAGSKALVSSCSWTCCGSSPCLMWCSWRELQPAQKLVHLPVQSEFEGVGTQGKAKHQRSNEMRELSLLAYLSQLQSPDPGPVQPLHSLTPYQVPHSAVALGVLHSEVKPSHMFYAANGSLVALCWILRGIDMVRGLYYLLTPVDPAVLRNVNCLLLGAISLPSCIVTTQGCEDSPYVTSNYSFDLTGAGKLRVFKGLIRPNQV